MKISYQEYTQEDLAQAGSTDLLAQIIFDPNLPLCDSTFCYNSGLQQLTQPAEPLLLESWRSEGAITRAIAGNISYAHDEKALFGHVQLQHGSALNYMIANAYYEAFTLLDNLGFPHLIRVWHYLPNLHQKEGEVSRYQLFCRGRNQAFAIDGRTAIERRCATTVIGTTVAQGTMFFIATRQPGTPIENPRQVNPWEYPEIEATAKPLFSRATWSGDLTMLFISGTASIIGHRSVYIDSTTAQLEQIFAHFDVLLKKCAQQPGVILNQFDSLKVYIRHITKAEILQQFIATCLSKRSLRANQIVFLIGEVCRSELDVEVEAVLSVQ